jgi:hypothetical protein
MLEFAYYKVEIRLIECLLGTVPRNRPVYAAHIATKAREHAERAQRQAERTGDTPHWAGGEPIAEAAGQPGVTVEERMAEEVATVPEETLEDIERKGWTTFHSDTNGKFLYSYALHGFLKEAGRAVREHRGTKQLQDKVNRYVRPAPRRIYLPEEVIENRPAPVDRPLIINTETGLVCERPLRAHTAMGPRVTVVRSDVIVEGTCISFYLRVLKGGPSGPILADLFQYGIQSGLGQWRSGGWGAFELLSFNKCELQEILDAERRIRDLVGLPPPPGTITVPEEAASPQGEEAEPASKKRGRKKAE